MRLIIDIDDEMYKRICKAQSVPDMYGTDVVNVINRIKKGTSCNNLQQIPQGEWEVFYTPKMKKVFRCNKCQAVSIQGKTKFCYNCGISMKGGAE